MTIAIVSVVALLVILYFVGMLYADWMWYDQVGFLEVLTTQWVAVVVMFLIGFVSMAVPVFVSIWLAHRFRPVYAKLSAQMDRYRDLVEPLRVIAMFAIPILFGVFAGVAAATRWPIVLLWLNGGDTDPAAADPVFGLPLGFYLFDLPFWRGVVAFASAAVLIAGLVAVLTSLVYGALRISRGEVWLSKPARVQLAITAALYLVLQGVSVWLDQYLTLTQSSSGLLTGASYADVNATIPGRVILAIACALVAALFIYTAVRGRWRLAIIGSGVLIASSVVVAGLYPWIIQRFQVDPNEKAYEAPYLQDNIDATRAAYGVDTVETESYSPVTTTEPGALREDADTTANIRIIDPALVTNAFAQLEQFKGYYQFPEYLDVDRYTLDGETQDTVLALRELNPDTLANQSWVNQALVYTHGYGLVAAFGNQRTADGQPQFLEGGIPVSGDLGDYEPRIYFGESSPEYSIVGAEEGARPLELDYPTDVAEDADGVDTSASTDDTSTAEPTTEATDGATTEPTSDGSEDVTGTNTSTRTYTFTGDGGPKIDNLFARLVYAIKFQSEQILLSEDVNSASQILYDRDPATRVSKVAPYLTLDSDPYPAIVDGRIVWIIDAYTTSANYPYSTTASLRQSIADTYTEPPLYANDSINYIRNSVKATVDAYDGSVTLYAWDETDPMLAAWQSIFPSTITPMSEMSGELLSHVRYPADLFKMQRTILGDYHVTDASSFYERNDAWQTPIEPTAENPSTARSQPPYYLTMQLPNQESPAFQLYTTFIPQQTGDNPRNVLTGYLAANSDAGSEDGVRGASYGQLTLLELPSSENTVPGPGQAQANFTTDNSVATELNILARGSTTVLRGNLLTLPVGGGLLYVQPVYVQATSGTSYPLLRRVLVSFGNQIAFEDTLDEALDELFGGDSGTDTPDGETPTDPTDPGTGEPTDPTDPSTGEDALADALERARVALAEREAAYAANDLVAAAQADQRLQQAIEDALAAEGIISGTDPETDAGADANG